MPEKLPTDKQGTPELIRGSLRPVAAAATALLALGLVACSSTPTTDRLEPQTMSSAPPADTNDEIGPDPRELPPAPDPESDPAPQPSGASGSRSALTVVIEETDPASDRRRTLVEAAAAERKRRETAGEPIAVITDKNLKDFSEGQLTEMKGPPATETKAQPRTDPSQQPVSPRPDEADDPETYWRGRVREARARWAATAEEIEHLRGRTAELRQRFYAEDDPYYRDAQIKPAWDRALDRLEEARVEVDEQRLEVRSILEAGRRAAALPGWLREGIELEPDIVRTDREVGPDPPGEHLPGEPKVAIDPDGRKR